MQMTLPWASTVDVSYVGQHGFNQLREIRGQQQVDINAVDFGAAFRPRTRIRRWRQHHAWRDGLLNRYPAALPGPGAGRLQFP